MKYDKRPLAPQLTKIFLDMDGVITDFNKRINEILKSKYQTTKEEYKNIWPIVEQEGESFWEDMEWTPWGRELYNFCTNLTPTYLLTSPSNSPASASGKMKWVYRELKTRDFIIAPPKWVLATPYHLLIDDTPKKIDKFNQCGGHTILFTQKHIVDNVKLSELLKNQIKEIVIACKYQNDD